MTTITIDRATVEQALEALELGHDSAKAEADRYHAAMAGYKLHRHAQMDAEVQQIAAAITALRAALAQPNPAQRVVDEQAEDEGLWFRAQTAAEAYLQQELRRLHAAVEGEK